MITIQKIKSSDNFYLSGLADLLIDGVTCGASVGFLQPLEKLEALKYWEKIYPELGANLCLWVAVANKTIVATVQLTLCQKENGLHRAEVQKLLVHSQFRNQGLAKKIMSTLEEYAKTNGVSLLVLDTQLNSDAELVYQHLKWIKAGEIPTYARAPDGTICATCVYYKIV